MREKWSRLRIYSQAISEYIYTLFYLIFDDYFYMCVCCVCVGGRGREGGGHYS